jgi:hypothetical protein
MISAYATALAPKRRGCPRVSASPEMCPSRTREDAKSRHRGHADRDASEYVTGLSPVRLSAHHRDAYALRSGVGAAGRRGGAGS